MAEVATATSRSRRSTRWNRLTKASRRARAELGVTAWGMRVTTLPPNWEGYPDHMHDGTVEVADQEEVYIPPRAAELVGGDERSSSGPG